MSCMPCSWLFTCVSFQLLSIHTCDAQQLMVDGMTFMVCPAPDDVQLGLATNAASLDTEASPDPSPPVDLRFDQRALKSLVYGLSEYVAGGLGGGRRGWVPVDGTLQVRRARALQRSSGYPHRLRLTQPAGEGTTKQDAVLTERCAWWRPLCMVLYVQ